MTCWSRCFRSAKRGPHSVATHYFLHFDSVVELHPIDDLREPFEPAQSSPAALGAQAELVDHREHSVAGQTSFRAIGPVAHGGEARLDHVRAADVDHPCAVGLACGSVRVVACSPNQRAIGRLNLPNWRHSAATRKYPESSHPPTGVKLRCRAYYDWT